MFIFVIRNKINPKHWPILKGLHCVFGTMFIIRLMCVCLEFDVLLDNSLGGWFSTDAEVKLVCKTLFPASVKF